MGSTEVLSKEQQSVLHRLVWFQEQFRWLANCGTEQLTNKVCEHLTLFSPSLLCLHQKTPIQ